MSTDEQQVEMAIDVRRKRASFRANHRGTKEMDWMLGKYADAHLAVMEADELSLFEQFLAMPDPELQRWLYEPDAHLQTDFQPLIDAIRAFHGLAGDGGAPVDGGDAA